VPLRQGEEIGRSPVQLEPEDIVLPEVQAGRNLLLLDPGPEPVPQAPDSVRVPDDAQGDGDAAAPPRSAVTPMPKETP
jgi:two-component system sensor histidine kinase MtrB